MLEAAQRQAAAGVDVVVGYVETHGRRGDRRPARGPGDAPRSSRSSTAASRFASSISTPPSPGTPTLLLVDELAHTNAPGLRHPKRWQDVEELLDAGINVYTTLNVQHLESLNDVIREITGDPGARDRARQRLRRGRFGGGGRPASRRAARAAAPGQGLRARPGRAGHGELLQRPQPGRPARDHPPPHRRPHPRPPGDGPAGRRRAASRPGRISETLLVCVGPSPTSAKVIRVSQADGRVPQRPLDRRQRGDHPHPQPERRAARDPDGEHPTGRAAGRRDGHPDRRRHRRRDRQLRAVAERHPDRHRQVPAAALAQRWSRPTSSTSCCARAATSTSTSSRGWAEAAQAPLPPGPRARRRWRPYLAALGLVVVAWVVACLLQTAGLSEANKAVVFLPAVIAGRHLVGPVARGSWPRSPRSWPSTSSSSPRTTRSRCATSSTCITLLVFARRGPARRHARRPAAPPGADLAGARETARGALPAQPGACRASPGPTNWPSRPSGRWPPSSAGR